MVPHSAHLSGATLRSILSSGHSRIPVFQCSRQEVIGLLLVKELLMREDEVGRSQGLWCCSTVLQARGLEAGI